MRDVIGGEIQTLLDDYGAGQLLKRELLRQLFFLLGRYPIDDVIAALPEPWRTEFVAWARKSYDHAVPVEDLVYVGSSEEPPEMRPIVRALRAWFARSAPGSDVTSAAPVRLSVSEFRSTDGTREQVLARFVLTSSGAIVTVAPSAHHLSVADKTVENGLPGPGGMYIKRDAGRQFLELLAPNFRGVRFFATGVFEMDESEAMTPPPLTTSPGLPRR